MEISLLIMEKSWNHIFEFLWEPCISGPSSARQRNAIYLNGVSLACRWWPNIECWLGSFIVFQGIRTSIAKKSYIFVIFQRGSVLPAPPPPPHTHLWIRACGSNVWKRHMRMTRKCRNHRPESNPQHWPLSTSRARGVWQVFTELLS